MLRIAVIGLGKMGQRHLEAWSCLDKCEVVGLVGRDTNKLHTLGSDFNAKVFTSLKDLFNQVEVDVVDICLPTYLHYPYVKQVAEAGKHVICEKPLGMNGEESRAILDICEQQNVQLYVGQTLRFDAEYVHAHNQVKHGVIGNPGVVRLSRGTAYPYGKDSWYEDDSKSGGILLDLGIHDFDWLIWTFGDVERVMAQHVKRELEDGRKLSYALVTLKMKHGTIAHVELSWAKTRLETSFEIAGKNGLIVSNSMENQPIRFTNWETSTKPTYLSNNIVEDSPILRQLEHFKGCILEGNIPIVTAEEAIQAVEVAEAAIQSAATGQPVNLVERKVTR
jgi:predicted dehydrogenase